ncbi:MAG: DNA mismatch repair endonuclease MutL [Lachnospiraceae bacterium]|nr:DNA mismatch repair endonuclease MutL [Lachnospiraceae bacterium]
MGKIQLLDTATINQIAAGEVIDRPSSIVKELMENAIDAGATVITVEIKDGGTSLIRISDNGCGIESEDIQTAFLRHSTSKIKSALDLLTVSSLGFRGEALSSIAAVCQVSVVTKTEDALTATRYVIEGGKEISLEEVGASNGTTFIVKNIFYNTPARRKFLKTAQTEAGYVSDVVEHIALSHPEISIRFISNGQARMHTPGNGSVKDVIYNIYGRDTANNVIELNDSCDFMKVTGFLGKPVINRGNRANENYFINGRYIKSGLIARCIEEAYKPYLMQHKYPFTVLHFEIDPELLDVNVHPAKMELRFRRQDQILPFVISSISKALKAKPTIVDVSLDKDEKNIAVIKRKEEKMAEPFEINRLKNNNKDVTVKVPDDYQIKESNQLILNKKDDNVTTESSTDFKKELNNGSNAKTDNESVKNINESSDPDLINKNNFISVNQELNVKEHTILKEHTTATEEYEEKEDTTQKEENIVKEDIIYDGKTLSLFNDEFLSESARVRHKIIGQVFDTYWIVEYDSKMFIIDQHAAHEKVLYESLMKRLKTRTVESQILNPPIIITLSMSEENLVKEHLDSFKKIGFEIEHFGGREYAVRAIPMDLYSLNSKELIIDIIDSLDSDSSKLNSEILSDRIATMSCKAAVKGNNRLSLKEADELIDKLLKLDNPYNCPHGRPTIISMSKYELERKFKRII